MTTLTPARNARVTEWWRPAPRATPAVEAPAAAAGDDRRDRLAFRALLVFTGILLLAPQEWLPVLQPLRIAFVTAGFAVASYVGGRLSRGAPLSIMPREMAITLVLLAWAVFTVPVSLHPGGSVHTLTDMWGKTLLVFWLLANTAAGLPRLRRVAWALSLMAVPPALDAIHNYATGVFMQGGAGQRIAGYDAPLTNNPNDLALMLNLTLPFTVTLLTLTRRRLARLVLLGIIALELIAIVLSFSRGGFITLGLVLVALVWRFARRRRLGPAVAVVALVLVLLPLVPGSYFDRLSSIEDMDRDATGSAQERWDTTVLAAKYVLEHPLVGTGLGNHVLGLNAMQGPRWVEVHNVYLQVGMDLGLPGLALYVALLLGCLGAARQAERLAAARPGGHDLAALAGAARLSLIAFSVAAFFHPSAYHVYFYYFAGLALAARAAAQAVPAAKPAPAAATGAAR